MRKDFINVGSSRIHSKRRLLRAHVFVLPFLRPIMLVVCPTFKAKSSGCYTCKILNSNARRSMSVLDRENQVGFRQQGLPQINLERVSVCFFHYRQGMGKALVHHQGTHYIF